MTLLKIEPIDEKHSLITGDGVKLTISNNMIQPYLKARQDIIEFSQNAVHQHTQFADRMIARHAILHGHIREHAKLLDVGTAHRGQRSTIEADYDRDDAGEFLNGLLVKFTLKGALHLATAIVSETGFRPIT